MDPASNAAAAEEQAAPNAEAVAAVAPADV